MASQPSLLKPWMKWGIIFLCWTGFALFFTYQIYLGQFQAGRPIDWLNPLLTCLTWAYVWFAVTPLILYVTKWLPLQRQHPIRWVLVHSLAAAHSLQQNSAQLRRITWSKRMWQELPH